jgi:Cupin domain.
MSKRQRVESTPAKKTIAARIRNYLARPRRGRSDTGGLRMAMKANQIQSPGGTEVLKLIAASNGVKKLGPKEGRTKQVGDVRLTWKATGEDTGYATSFYEMDLPPGKGIPLHSHPYAEVFYVVMGHTDFLRVDKQGQEEWVRCGPGDTLVAPMTRYTRSTIAQTSQAVLSVRPFTITRCSLRHTPRRLTSTIRFRPRKSPPKRKGISTSNY